jgi:hypothetical protein
MPSGLFVSDCSSSDWAWLDFGCTIQAAGSAVGQGVSSALQPVYTLLIIVGVIALIALALIAFSPNVKHVIPHLGFG